jgi:hypothetical protein
VILVVAFWRLPGIVVGGKLTDPERLKAENDVRTTLVQALVGFGLLIGLYFTARTYRLNREGQVTERFTRAIDQLGSPQLDVRLGGIYALERIARDSRRDHWTIMEVLTAFVREHARLTVPPDSHPTRPMAGDVQAALTVLARRDAHQEDAGQKLNLRNSDLAFAQLDSAQFQYADLSFCRMYEASLRNAKLSHATLTAAGLLGAQMQGAELQHADLRANLFNADLQEAVLQRANLESANLGTANLEDADLVGAYLHDIRLLGARCSDRQLRDGGLNDEEIRAARER